MRPRDPSVYMSAVSPEVHRIGEFIRIHIVGQAASFDANEAIPRTFIATLSNSGLLAAGLPKECGGLGLDMEAFGSINEDVGQACSAVRALVGVQTMVGRAIVRWGTEHQKRRWLHRLAAGDAIAAFALTEAEAGSDARVTTEATARNGMYVLNGCKKWISFGTIADVFLVFATTADGPAAFLVTHDTPGLRVRPIVGILGLRGSMVSEVEFENCRIPFEASLGPPGFGLSHVGATALSYGRYSVACGCVGISRGCLDASLRYCRMRQQFGKPLSEHQLVQRLISRMAANTDAARLLCKKAGRTLELGDPSSVLDGLVAKYFASTTAMQSASDAVQIHGANGCSSAYPVERYLRDAKVMEIIEGSTQLQEVMIARCLV